MTPFPTYAETPGAPFSRPFPKLDFWMHFGHPLAHFGLPFGSLWLPFGSLWLPFGSLGYPFGTIGLTFGSLWLTFGLLLASFGSLLLSPGHFFRIFMYFRQKCRAKSYFYIISIRFSIFELFCNLSPFVHSPP